MKKRRLFYALPLVAMLLVACGDSEDNSTKESNTNKTEENEAVTNNTTDDSNEATDTNEATDATESKENNNSAVTDATKDKEELPFAEFSLDVDYPTGEYTLDYEKQFSGEEAELEDERKKSKIVGEEALTNLKPLLKKFTFDVNSTEEDVKKQLFSIIKIDDDYTRIELDIQFHDGVEKEYIFTK